MKHQLFKKNTYVTVDVGRPHLTVVGQVKDSTIRIKRIVAEDSFFMPQQAIELKENLLVLPIASEIQFFRGYQNINEIIGNYNGLLLEKKLKRITEMEYHLFVSIEDLNLPSEGTKELFRTLKKKKQ